MYKRQVSISLRFGDFSRANRARTLPFPTDQTEAILAAVRELFEVSREEIEAKDLTLIGVSLGNLEQADTVQMELPLDGGPVSYTHLTLPTGSLV